LQTFAEKSRFMGPCTYTGQAIGKEVFGSRGKAEVEEWLLPDALIGSTGIHSARRASMKATVKQKIQETRETHCESHSGFERR